MVTVVENTDPKNMDSKGKPVPAVITELTQKYAGKFVVQHTVDEATGGYRKLPSIKYYLGYVSF